MTIYYFAYGMNSDPQQMRLRTGVPRAIGSASIQNHAFRFSTHADVYPKVGSETVGVLWSLNEQQLAQLDDREGYPYYYNRKIVDVESGGKIYQAWMYYMVGEVVPYPPSDEYYAMLDRGYTHFAVPKYQIIHALADSIVGYMRIADNVQI